MEVVTQDLDRPGPKSLNRQQYQEQLMVWNMKSLVSRTGSRTQPANVPGVHALNQLSSYDAQSAKSASSLLSAAPA